MRALRDFNLPKIVTSDVPIFLGLISDLFPQLDVPRKRDPGLEDSVRQSVSELRLQPEENFILKVFKFSIDKIISCSGKKKKKKNSISEISKNALCGTVCSYNAESMFGIKIHHIYIIN